ncbi:MAG: hypothetical protein ACR2OZ_15660 [Verrucomicrobiales bacterium]
MNYLFVSMLMAASLARVSAFPIVSNDGITKDFPVIKSASREGLIVRETPGGRDIPVPWERLDIAASRKANPWLATIHKKALEGETVTLDLGLGGSPEDLADWRTSKKSVAGGGRNFDSLSLTAYIHREVKKPRLAVLWIGHQNPLAKRPDAADFARRANAALVLANFAGNYTNAALGSGEALLAAVSDLLGEKKTGASSKYVSVPPALLIIGEREAATFAWSFLCEHHKSVVGAVCIDGSHETKPNPGAFLTPLLLIETQRKQPGLDTAGGNLDQPFDLWRHYSTEGSRWCYVNAFQQSDPLALAVAFAQSVAALSPYQEVLNNLEDWENNELKNRIPMPIRTVRDFKENKTLLGILGAKQTFPLASKKGEARHDLIWLPTPEFARFAAGR